MTRLSLLIALLFPIGGCTSATSPRSQALDVHDASLCDPGLVGTWVLTSFDAPTDGIQFVDPPAERYRFDADCTWSFSATGDDYSVVYPNAYFAVDGSAAQSCDSLDTFAGEYAGACSMNDSVCDCTYAAAGLDHAGTWSTSFGQLELDQPGQGTRQRYVAGEDTLDLFFRFGSWGTVGTFTRR